MVTFAIASLIVVAGSWVHGLYVDHTNDTIRNLSQL